LAAVVVAGLGYVGLPLAMRAIAVGHEVIGYDTDAVRVKRLEAGESYVEDVSSCELAAARDSGRFRLSANADACTGFDVAVITVPTPLRDGLPDLAYIEAASQTLSRYLRPGSTVIVESTSFPGTTPGSGAYLAGRGVRAGGGHRFPPRLQP
jgi:UDP-N-acetyl-D-glucosamine dehydrogenase